MGSSTVKSPVRLPIILTAAVALLLSGAVIVVSAVNLSAQNSAPVVEAPDSSPSHSAGEYAWSDALAALVEEANTKITREAYGIAADPGWIVWGAYGDSFSISNLNCSSESDVVNEGDVQSIRQNCFDLNGTLAGYFEQRFRLQAPREWPVETPSDWPWTQSQIDEERQVMLTLAASLNLPICPGLFTGRMGLNAGDPPCFNYAPYLSEEFVTTGKILVPYSTRGERLPCVSEICTTDQRGWTTIDTATVEAWKQYWKRFSAYCQAMFDFNSRLKVLSETDPELTWDSTTYDRAAFKYNQTIPPECSFPQLPPTQEDWLKFQNQVP